MQELIGTTLGHYRIVEQIVAGGLGVVYRARDERLVNYKSPSLFQDDNPLSHRGKEIDGPNRDRGSIGQEAFNL